MDKTLLPMVIQEIVDLVGMPAALRVVEHYGGQTISFSAKRREIAILTDNIVAGELARRFGGVPTSVPLCKSQTIAERNKAILIRFDELTEAGSARLAVAQIAKEFRMTDRHVWRLLKLT